MIRILTLALFLVLLPQIKIYSQETKKIIEYTYDKTGNRIKRQTITVVIPEPTSLKSAVVPVEREMGERKIVIYPNPTRGDLKIGITGGQDEPNYEYKLFDPVGKCLITSKITSLGEYGVPMERYASGVYILIIKDEEKSLTYKIIKK